MLLKDACSYALFSNKVNHQHNRLQIILLSLRCSRTSRIWSLDLPGQAIISFDETLDNDGSKTIEAACFVEKLIVLKIQLLRNKKPYFPVHIKHKSVNAKTRQRFFFMNNTTFYYTLYNANTSSTQIRPGCIETSINHNTEQHQVSMYLSQAITIVTVTQTHL